MCVDDIEELHPLLRQLIAEYIYIYIYVYICVYISTWDDGYDVMCVDDIEELHPLPRQLIAECRPTHTRGGKPAPKKMMKNALHIYIYI
jgi:hypothetical protein